MRDEGSAVVGSNYSLFCDVTIPTFKDTITVAQLAYIKWVCPSGRTQEAPGKYALVFSPLTLNDEGTCTCTAHYLVVGISSPSASSHYHVTVSKSKAFLPC